MWVYIPFEPNPVEWVIALVVFILAAWWGSKRRDPPEFRHLRQMMERLGPSPSMAEVARQYREYERSILNELRESVEKAEGNRWASARVLRRLDAYRLEIAKAHDQVLQSYGGGNEPRQLDSEFEVAHQRELKVIDELRLRLVGGRIRRSGDAGLAERADGGDDTG